MEKITDGRFDRLLDRRRFNESNPVITEVDKMDVGDVLFVAKDDWTLSTPIGSNIQSSCNNKRARLYGKGFTVRVVETGGGWAIKRTK